MRQLTDSMYHKVRFFALEASDYGVNIDINDRDVEGDMANYFMYPFDFNMDYSRGSIRTSGWIEFGETIGDATRCDGVHDKVIWDIDDLNEWIQDLYDNMSKQERFSDELHEGFNRMDEE